MLKHEVDLIRSLDHPNIIQIYESYENFQNYWMISMKLVRESLEQFTKRITNKGKLLKDEDAAMFMRGIL